MEHVQVAKSDYQILTGSTIKIIALVTMFIDHFAAIVLRDQLYYYGTLAQAQRIKPLYDLCRGIGRMSFPLFCFLLVEGFVYTRSRKKYALRLFIFALISELPFEWTFYPDMNTFSTSSCNIFFTLLIGLEAMVLMEYVDKQNFLKGQRGTFLIQVLIMYLCGALANWIKADYGAYGIYLICVMYCFRGDKNTQILATFLIMGLCHYFEPMYLATLLCMWLYNGQKGNIRLKYFFYAFYPLHLLFLLGCVYCINYLDKL